MVRRPFLNRSESRTLDLLERALCDTAWRPHANCRISDVLDISKDDPAKYRRLHQWGHFDFVILNRVTDSVAFVIEFDSPWHDPPHKQDNDRIKDELCLSAGLPVLRVRDDEITEHDRATMLEWVIERFVRWQREQHRILRLPTELEKDMAYTAFKADHTFAAIDNVIARLHREAEITCAAWGGWGEDGAVPGPVDQSGLYVTPSMGYLASLGLGEDVVEEDRFERTGVASLLVCRADSVVFQAYGQVQVGNTSAEHLRAFSDLLGTNYVEMQARLAEYRALLAIDRWADRNILKIAA